MHDADLRQRTPALRPPLRTRPPPLTAKMLQHVDDCTHVADPVQIHLPRHDLATGQPRNEFIYLPHDPPRAEEPRARAQHGHRRVALRRLPAIDVDEKFAGPGGMTL